MASTLALDGGNAVVSPGSVKSWPPLTQADRDAVMAVFDSGHLHGTSAPKALELQEKWAAYVGTKYALTTNSGTAAIHMAVAGAGIGPGDEVITSAFTYWSTAASILHHNAIPVFVDIDPLTYTMDPALVEPTAAVARQFIGADIRVPGVPFAPVVTPRADAGPTERLANWSGRVSAPWVTSSGENACTWIPGAARRAACTIER